MEWLNYHHLLYFWTVVREGGVSKAAARLSLSQPTVSAQVKMLEDALGERLFERKGRALVLTEVGRVVHRYADDIFGLGRELIETLRGRPAGRALQLTVGVANAVPKLVVYRLLRPATVLPEPIQLICREDNADQLVAQLATHTLDLVIADSPAPPHVRVRVFNRLLGDSGITFFAPARLGRRVRQRFPQSLDGVPMLLPTINTALRRALEDWFDRHGLRPQVVGEFEDSALMTAFADGSDVVFPAASAIEREMRRYYRVQVAGRSDEVRERYFAISAERRLTHPGVLAITSQARASLFR